MLVRLLGIGAVIAFTTTSAISQVSYRFRNFSINDGLSQSSVTTIVQDNVGTLWLGTQDGLNRFDGQQFEVFTSDDTPGLASSYIHCGLKDQFGELWFGTADGVSVYNPKKETFRSILSSDDKNLSIESVSEEANGNIWLGSSTYGLAKYDRKTKKVSFLTATIPSKRIHYIKFVTKKELIVSFEDAGVYIYNIESKIWKQLSISKGHKAWLVSDVEPFSENSYVFSTNQGLWLFDSQTHKLFPFLKFIGKDYGIDEFSDVYVKSTSEFYIATVNNGLISVNNTNEGYRITFSKKDIFQKNGILFNEINELFCDENGTIWVGTLRGLSGFNPKNDSFFGVGPSSNLSLGLPSESVWGFAESKDLSKVYIATDFAVSELNRKTGTFKHYYISKAQDVNDNSIVSIHYLTDEHFLIGANDGLYDLKIKNGTGVYHKVVYKGIDNPLIFQRLYKITPYKESQFFIATKGGVLLYNQKTGEFTPFVNNPKKPKTTIGAGVCRVSYKGLNDTYYFATGVGGINLLTLDSQGKEQIVPYEFNKSILKASRDVISTIYQENETTLWLGSSGSGLLKLNLKTGKVVAYTRKQGLPNNFVYGILPDERGNLWLSTNKGLARFNTNEERCTNYSEVNGLMSNEFNTGAYLLSKTGEMYFGGIEGYNFFNPKNLQEQRDKIYVNFLKFRFDDRWLKPGDSDAPFKESFSSLSDIKLGYDERSFTIRFKPTDIINRELLQFKYELVGLDEGSVFLGSSSEIHFTSLSPGSYVLKIYVRRVDGDWIQATSEMNIEVASPFWWKWWFWVIVLVVLTMLILLFIQSRINLARRDQVRLEIKIVERTKEIRAQNMKIESQKKVIEKEKTKVEEQSRLLQIEKDKTENLLRNMIPESTAEELKTKGRASARAYKTVSVLFTDFVGFTKIAEGMKPTDLVNKLDVYFRKFDEIIVKNNLEKIKTIGDAYMCAGGVPVRNNTNPIDAVLAALQIQEYMTNLKTEGLKTGSEFWELRLGINTGEVTAGVIGSERLAYDIWGATVNQAQRMEMMGEPGRVTISGSTFKLIEPYFECTYRGKVKTKSKGLIEMFTVERIKPELSINGEGLYPNDRFQQIVNLHLYSSINYYKAERHIMRVLEKGLSPMLHYHSIEHTKDVVRAVERYALLEGVTDEGLFLLKSAATYHDAGFVEIYEKNEPVGARMAEEILPKYGYSEQHIAQIKELIFVTQIPHQPKNKLEQIICDADLDYLGRDDFHEIADRLRRELREHGKIDSDRQWDNMQVFFLNMHKYFTPTAIASRQAKKMKNLKEVEERLARDEYKD
ncbi:adenylate/guanylate cyclase domain-containing protein [Fluviicola taffensis]|uniref:Adenylate/guanylate cyclase n=1 Tax=Fluviicola taffensis (strain DSM 16823 / NCIMB 13979 / RW262) TaxID=755732 RepID=F2IF73_FLUTR|nr:adenylate/guanylate cyclase domain-containing protein [Fluviicola taffensis]AEA43547.1 adenylate/guanylate cyclase [Fluviicola taffensis DSM 16823]